MELKNILLEFGLSDKETSVYLSLLELGPSPARTVARKAGVNRGTTYDILRKLSELGLASFYQKTKQHFAAEPPEKLVQAVEDKQTQLQRLKINIAEKLPELKTLFVQQGGRPAIRIYEGTRGVRQILEDVLDSMSVVKDKTYFVFSSATLRKNVYQSMPDFSSRRIKKGIKVKTISLGEGGQLVGLDERKWLKPKKDLQATYEIIYAGKVAHISLNNAEHPVGILIENKDIYETQKMIFEFNWNQL